MKPHFTTEKEAVECAERIVIDYADFSGREESLRVPLRESAIRHITATIYRVCQSAYKAGLHKGYAEEGVNCHEHCEVAKKEGRVEERAFILNVLDGIDKADTQMGNTGGGTKAIRFA